MKTDRSNVFTSAELRIQLETLYEGFRTKRGVKLLGLLQEKRSSSGPLPFLLYGPNDVVVLVTQSTFSNYCVSLIVGMSRSIRRGRCWQKRFPRGTGIQILLQPVVESPSPRAFLNHGKMERRVVNLRTVLSEQSSSKSPTCNTNNHRNNLVLPCRRNGRSLPSLAIPVLLSRYLLKATRVPAGSNIPERVC